MITPEHDATTDGPGRDPAAPGRTPRWVGRLLWHAPRELVVLLLRVYQLTLSPLLGPVCRFAPSCSSYAVTAVRRYGVLQGGWLTTRRLLRCHPWNDGGWDPVPERGDRHDHTHERTTTS